MRPCDPRLVSFSLHILSVLGSLSVWLFKFLRCFNGLFKKSLDNSRENVRSETGSSYSLVLISRRHWQCTSGLLCLHKLQYPYLVGVFQRISLHFSCNMFDLASKMVRSRVICLPEVLKWMENISFFSRSIRSGTLIWSGDDSHFSLLPMLLTGENILQADGFQIKYSQHYM